MIYLAQNDDLTIHKAYTRKASAQSRVSTHGGRVLEVELLVAKPKPRKPAKHVLLDLMPKSEGGFL